MTEDADDGARVISLYVAEEDLGQVIGRGRPHRPRAAGGPARRPRTPAASARASRSSTSAGGRGMTGAPVVIGRIGRPHGLGGEVRTPAHRRHAGGAPAGTAVEVAARRGASPGGWWWRAAPAPTSAPSSPSQGVETRDEARALAGATVAVEADAAGRAARSRHLLRARSGRLRGAPGRAARSAPSREVHAAPANDVLEVSGADGDRARALHRRRHRRARPRRAGGSSSAPTSSTGLSRRADRRLHALPGVVRLDAPPAPPGQRGDLGRPRAALLLAPRHHAAGRTPRSTTPLRRRPRDGDARRRDGGRAGGRLRRARRAR